MHIGECAHEVFVLLGIRISETLGWHYLRHPCEARPLIDNISFCI